MSLDDLRRHIDELDFRIVRLIAERMEVSRQIGEEKRETGKPVYDGAREQWVLERVKNAARDANLLPGEIEKIYRQLFLMSKGFQGITVAFQGEMGAYSEEASYQYFGSGTRLQPCESLEEVFQAVDMEEAKYGLVPAENSLEGSIPRSYDLLLDSNLKVRGETQLRIIHCLISLPEAQIDSIREVYSHPQALGQSKTFLKQMGWKQVPTYDTAGSVKLIKESATIEKAAIASARAAEIYGMKVLVRGIEDNANNFTRFFVLGKEDAPASGVDKTSIVFSVKHQPGALYEALKELAVRKINLTKIESRPTRQKPWEYNFYVDFEGHREDSAVKEALVCLGNSAIFVKILGSYPRVI